MILMYTEIFLDNMKAMFWTKVSGMLKPGNNFKIGYGTILSVFICGVESKLI